MGIPTLALLLVAAASQSSTVTLWPDSATPGTASANDPMACELGVKFTSDVDGAVLGIRFYKGSGNTGTHIGNLWNPSGTNLGTVTFTGETASGWQHMNFANPVPITAKTTYVASCFCPDGHYAADNLYFNAAYDNPPLHALQDGAQGGNGVYVYNGTSAFPNQTYQGSNYWIDVIFSPASSSTSPTPTPSPSATPTSASAAKGSGASMGNCGCGLAGAGSGAGWLSAAALAAALLAARAGRR